MILNTVGKLSVMAAEVKSQISLVILLKIRQIKRKASQNNKIFIYNVTLTES